MKSSNNIVAKINLLLPQTQCQQCGYEGCLPYATALADNSTDINLCLPGQEEVMQDLAELLQKTPVEVSATVNQTVYIDEMICIGCKACIKACPVDAIVGTTKKMHTVINQECTGCKLCIPVCPVDCIFPENENIKYLPKNPILSQLANDRMRAAEHARIRFEHRNLRLEKIAQEKQAERLNKPTPNHLSSKLKLDPTSLLAKAKINAAKRKNNRVAIDDQSHVQKRLLEEQKRAAYRKAQKDFRYGTPSEKEKALRYLRQVKAEAKQK